MVKRKSLSTRLRGASAQIRFRARRIVCGALGVPATLDTEDRRLLEREILPWFAQRPEFRRILFVGCDWYTVHYEAMFRDREYWTMEFAPDRRRFGAARHVTDSIANLSTHFGEASLDFIVCNGVLGWGLDDPQEAERAFAACARCLAPFGVFLLGWNDIPVSRVLVPRESRGLAPLTPFTFPPWGTSTREVPTAYRHIYEFYQRPAR